MSAAPNGTDDLWAVADRMLATAAPGEELEVMVARSNTTRVRAYDGEVEALTTAEVSGVGVRVIADGRQGFASAGSLAGDVVDEVLAEARDNMPFAVADPHVALAHPDGVAAPQLDIWDDSVRETEIGTKIEMAIELERRVRAGDPRITGVRTASYGDSAGSSVLASTTGVRASTSATSSSLGVLALASDGGRTQSGSGSTVARGPSGLELDDAARDAIERATALLGATQPPSQKVTLVLEPRMVGSLLGIIGGMLSGERVLKGRTPFADRVHELVASPALTMVDDPTDPESFGARFYDGEGLAARANPLLSAGVLQGFLHNTVSASRAQSTTTASAVRGVRSTPGVGWHAIAVSPGSGSLDDLIASVDNGLFVRSMAGLHSGVNAVSGDFSVGAEGTMIRNGELAEPVREVTIASTLPKLLQDIVAIGADIERLPGGLSCPPMTIANVSMSGS